MEVWYVKEKANKVLKERGIDFEILKDMIESDSDRLLDILPDPNPIREGDLIFVILYITNYVVSVPIKPEENDIYKIKTAYFDREYDKQYNSEERARKSENGR